MNNKHVNCTHPKRSVRRFGARRRQCGVCKKTWRVRKKKRGRKRVRVVTHLIDAYLTGLTGTLRQGASRRHISLSSMHRRLAHSLRQYVRTRSDRWRALIPEHEALILIADAIWYRIQGKKYGIYVFLIRPVTATHAVILPPILLPGHENVEGWLLALNHIPMGIRARIKALVCDGGTGVTALAPRNGWLLQRCQFHFLAAVQNYCTTGTRSKNPTFARRVMALVQRAFIARSSEELETVLATLATIRAESRSKGLRRVLNGLALHIDEHRNVLAHPKWKLPTTSNSAESFIQCIRNFLYVHRGFRSETMLRSWLAAIAAHKKTIRCNGKHQPN